MISDSSKKWKNIEIIKNLQLLFEALPLTPSSFLPVLLKNQKKLVFSENTHYLSKFSVFSTGTAVVGRYETVRAFTVMFLCPFYWTHSSV